MRHLTILIALVCCTLFALPRASAQGLLISDPRLTGDQRDCIVLTLELDEDQQDQFDELATVYAVEIAQIFSELEEMGQEMDREEFTVQDGIELWEEVSDRINARQAVLFDDLALFISDEQARRIPLCRTRLRRMGVTNGDITASLPGGIAMGIDPVTLAIELGIPTELDDDHRAAFERAMTSYDNAMKRNIDSLVENVLKLIAKAEGFEDDPMAAFMRLQEEIQSVVKDAKTLREDHQDLGLAMARALPDTLGERWTDRFMRALYPGPYARIDSEVILERLLDQTDLSDQEFAAVLEISADLRKRAEPIRKEWCDELDDFFRKFEFNIMTMTMFDPDNLGRQFRERMLELNEQTFATLRTRVKNDVVEELIEAMNANTVSDGGRPRRGNSVEVRVETGEATPTDEEGVELEITTEDGG